MAERDRIEFAPFLKSEVLAQEVNLLPANPRELRAFIRGLWCLASEVERHDEDELDQHLLIILEALRQASPAFLSALLDREDLLNLGASAFTWNEDRAEFEQGVQQLAEEVSPGSNGRTVQLALALCGRSLHWRTERIRYHAYLGERPHAVTWREFRSLLDCATDADRATWVSKQAQDRRVSEATVVHECLSSCVQSYEVQMEKAAATRTAGRNRRRVEHANRNLDLLEWLWFRSAIENEARSPTMFRRVVNAFRAWAHFVLNDADKALRDREREILIAMAKSASDPLDFLEALAPWDSHNERRDEAPSLTDALLAELEERAADEVMRAFDRPSGIAGCLFGARGAERHLLLHSKPMWCKKRLDILAALVANASDVVADNCHLLLRAVVEPPRHLPCDASELRTERELLRLLWDGASAVPAQARFFQEMDQLRDEAGTLVGDELPRPAWWERVRAMVARSTAADSLPTDSSDSKE